MLMTIIDKIWDAHTVRTEEGGRSVLYIDRQYIHEVTSPVAFAGLEGRGRNGDGGVPVARPKQVTATADHNIPTQNQHLPIEEEQGRRQVEALTENCARHGIELFGVGHPRQGIVHIIGPEQGFTQPGMTIICGDSHTSTHGAMGAIAFGVGTSEVEMALASQCIIQSKPRTMRITVDGALGDGVEAKDLILYLISRISTSGGTGYFIEFAGETIRGLSMEGRMTVCNMAIECGARGGIVAPDQVTFDYLKGRPEAPSGAEWDAAVERWRELASDTDAADDNVGHEPRRRDAHNRQDSRKRRPEGVGIHGVPIGRETDGKTRRLRVRGELHQRPDRRPQAVRASGGRSAESRGRNRVDSARIERGGTDGAGRRDRENPQQSGVRAEAARMLGMPGDERR